MITIQEQIKLLQAIDDGKTLQSQFKVNTNLWTDLSAEWHGRMKSGEYALETRSFRYRIKPEPKVIWVNEYANNCYGIYLDEETAKHYASYDAVSIAVKYQEVL